MTVCFQLNAEVHRRMVFTGSVEIDPPADMPLAPRRLAPQPLFGRPIQHLVSCDRLATASEFMRKSRSTPHFLDASINEPWERRSRIFGRE
jgi:hypothetical protein